MYSGRWQRVYCRWRLFQQGRRAQFSLFTFEVSCPFFVFVGAHRQTNRTVVLSGKVRETAASIEHITRLPYRVDTCCRASLFRYRVSRTILLTRFATIAKFRNTKIKWFITFHGQIGNHSPQSKQRTFNSLISAQRSIGRKSCVCSSAKLLPPNYMLIVENNRNTWVLSLAPP